MTEHQVAVVENILKRSGFERVGLSQTTCSRYYGPADKGRDRSAPRIRLSDHQTYEPVNVISIVLYDSMSDAEVETLTSEAIAQFIKAEDEWVNEQMAEVAKASGCDIDELDRDNF
jgi:hypothetical protein